MRQVVASTIFGLFLVWLGVTLLSSASNFRTNGVTANGEVVAVRPVGKHDEAMFRFALPSGEGVKCVSDEGITGLRLKPGDRIVVLYDKNDPRTCQAASLGTGFTYPVGFLTLGVLWIIATFVSYWWNGRHR